MIYDEFNAAKLATQATGAILHEASVLCLLARLCAGLLLGGCGSMVLVALSSGAIQPFATPWSKAVLGWSFVGLVFVVMGVVPVLTAVKFLGQRWVYDFDQLRRHLPAQSRWFGITIRSRCYPFDSFERVTIRRDSPRGVFVKRSAFIVSYEGRGAPVVLVWCSKSERAKLLAQELAAQLAVPIDEYINNSASVADIRPN